MQNKNEKAILVFSSTGSRTKKPKIHVMPILTKHVLSITVWRFKLELFVAVDVKFLVDDFKAKQCFLNISTNKTQFIISMIMIGNKIPNVIGCPLNQQL